MPVIEAFRGIRYDLGHVGSLSDVTAPPYDVIGPEMQDELYKRHPANAIRLILNRDEPGDDEEHNRYSRAARFLRNWQREGVLRADGDPAIYVYHQEFAYGGQQFTRRGFMSRVRLQRFGEGNIYPHEETHSAAKEDRLKLTKACRANLSQIFGLYPDPDNAAQEILEGLIQGVIPTESTDHLGVVHRIWPVSDVKRIAELGAIVGPKPMFVADGHHRYETACNYRDYLDEQGKLTDTSSANSVLTMCVSMNDPGMIVLPTHRLFRGLPPIASDELANRLNQHFDTRVAGEGVDLADTLWETIELEGDQGQMACFCSQDQRWVNVRLNQQGAAKMAELASDRSDDWRGLGVSILQRLILEDLLGATDLPKPKYVHLVEELVDAIQRDAAAPEFSLAVLVMPATLDHVRAISEHGERMPAKSTYFYPKLLSGLVINSLE